MALAKTVKSSCCEALVAWSYYLRVGDIKKKLHRFCSKCAKDIKRKRAVKMRQLELGVSL